MVPSRRNVGLPMEFYPSPPQDWGGEAKASGSEAMVLGWDGSKTIMTMMIKE